MYVCMCVMRLHAAVPQSWSFFPRDQSHTGLCCDGAEWGHNATISFSDSPRTTKGEREEKEKAKKKEKGLGCSDWKPEAGLSPPRKKVRGEPKARYFFLGGRAGGPMLVKSFTRSCLENFLKTALEVDVSVSSGAHPGILTQSDQLAWPQLHPEQRRDGKHASQAALALLSFETFTGARHSGMHSHKHSTQEGGVGSRICGQPELHSKVTATKNKWGSLRRLHRCSLADTKKDGHNG